MTTRLVVTCFLVTLWSIRLGSQQSLFDSSRIQRFKLKNQNQNQNLSSVHSLRASDHLLDDNSPQENRPEVSRETGSAVRMSRPAVMNTNRYRERRKRLRTTVPSSTTTTTTTTTPTTTTLQPNDDYYEYDDYYDDYDYHLTTTTTTTTTEAPKRRRGGRRRWRRPTEPPSTTTTTTLSPNYKPRSDGRVIDYSVDPNFPYELKGADLTEYPFFISIPENNFECKGRHDGYYANIQLKCQVYHHCAVGHQRYDFLCPNYTLFDQTTFTCRFINTVDCLSAESHYNRNNELYVEKNETTIQSNSSLI